MCKYFEYIYIILILFVSAGAGNAQSVTATGNWVYSVAATDITQAGTNFTGTYVSASSQTSISLTVGGNSQWRVYIARTAGTWSNSLIISALRTTNGTGVGGVGQIAGGTNYQAITTIATQLFNGRRSRTGIGIQYQVSGVSVTLPAATYSTSIIYTITAP